MESLAYDCASHGALDYKFSNTSNTSFLSSSVQLKSLNNCNITVDDLCSLSALECETILEKHLEMIRSEHLMRKTIQKASPTILDDKSSKGSAPLDYETNLFSKVVFTSSQSEVVENVSESVTNARLELPLLENGESVDYKLPSCECEIGNFSAGAQSCTS